LFSPLYGFAQTCPISLQVTYADGEKGCLTDLPLSKLTDKAWGRSLFEVAKSARHYTITFSSICNIATIGISNRQHPGQAKSEAEQIALSQCSDKCECAIIVDNGKVLLSQKLASLIGANTTNLADKSNWGPTEIEKTQKDQALLVLESSKQKQIQIAKEEELERQRIAELQRKRELEMQAQKQRDLDIAKQREIEAQKFAEAQKIKDLQARQKAEAESREREKLLALAADAEKKKTEETERQRAKTESEFKEREKQLALAAEQEKHKAKVAQEEADKAVRLASAEQNERLKDRELLLQLSAELSRLRAESEALKKAQTESRMQVVALPAKIQSIPATPVVFANRKALVIGNDGYKFVSKLFNAKEDANSMAENLTKVGYKVTLKVDQSEKEMKAALRGFKSQVEAGDEVAIFYAGHGVQLANTNYLLPIDVAGEGEEQIKDEAISLQRILDDMSDKKVKFTLAMIDACRDNPFKGSGRSIGGELEVWRLQLLLLGKWWFSLLALGSKH